MADTAPNAWEQASKTINFNVLSEFQLSRLQESGWPGTEAIEADGTCPLQARIDYLHALCGVLE